MRYTVLVSDRLQRKNNFNLRNLRNMRNLKGNQMENLKEIMGI